MGGLQHIRTTVPSAKGDIHIELRAQAESFTMDLNSPAGTSAIIGIPKQAGSTITSIRSGDVTIWEHGKASSTAAGISFMDESAHHVRFMVNPGQWSIRASIRAAETKK